MAKGGFPTRVEKGRTQYTGPRRIGLADARRDLAHKGVDEKAVEPGLNSSRSQAGFDWAWQNDCVNEGYKG